MTNKSSRLALPHRLRCSAASSACICNWDADGHLVPLGSRRSAPTVVTQVQTATHQLGFGEMTPCRSPGRSRRLGLRRHRWSPHARASTLLDAATFEAGRRFRHQLWRGVPAL